MRQRLGLAAAILRRPALVVLDEPANGLDPAGIRQLRELLRRLAGEGTTIFLSSHLLGEVERVCDRVAVIDRGRLVSTGVAADWRPSRRPRSPADHDRGGRNLRRPKRPAPAEVCAGDAPGQLMVSGTDGRSANRALAAAGIYAAAIVPEHHSLEERFLAITQEGPHAAASG